jgi:hypothetical protein
MLIPVNIIRNSPFSASAVITTSAGAVTVRGIFEKDVSLETLENYGFTLGSPVFSYITSDCPEPRQGMAFSCNGKSYKINNYEHRDLGYTMLELINA